MCMQIILFGLTACVSSGQVKTFEDTLNEGHIPIKEAVWAKEQGDKFQHEIVSKGLVYRKPEVQQYISSIENRLLADDPKINAAIDIFVLRSPSANAFALPNGAIYIHSGLFTVLKSEDQLAGIVAHEIAHITKRHSVKQVISNKNTLITAHIANFATGGLGLAYLPAAASIMNYSRSSESEADRAGLDRLIKAGFRPQAMAEVFQQFQSLPGMKHIKDSIYSSHPSQAKRIADLTQLMSTIDINDDLQKKTADNNDTFMLLKRKMMEDNIEMYLKYRQYFQAQAIVDQADEYYSNANKLAFYQGEIFAGLSKHVIDAGAEKNWIETGKINRNSKYLDELKAAKQDNLHKAEKSYLAALQGESGVTTAYKRLAQIAKENAKPVESIRWYKQYLETAPTSRDRRYIERMISRLEKSL